jgi:hypothetical protein
MGDTLLLSTEGGWGTEEMSWVQKWIAGKILEAAAPFIGSQSKRSAGFGGCWEGNGR